MKFSTWVFVIFTAFILSACGESSSGGGNGTTTSAATVDGNNKTEVAKTAKVGSEQAIEVSTAPKSLTRNSLSYSLMKDTVSLTGPRLMGRETIDLGICTTGSATYETSGQNSQNGTFTIVYDNCVYSYGAETTEVDGTASWTTNDDGSFFYEYDITVTYAGETTTVTGTYSCDAEYNCSYSDNFVEGGTSYTISNAEVTNTGSGFNVSVRVTNENFGYIDVVATGLVLCPGGGFQTGSISVTDSSGSIVLQVDFVNCSEMTVTFDGVAETVPQ